MEKKNEKFQKGTYNIELWIFQINFYKNAKLSLLN